MARRERQFPWIWVGLGATLLVVGVTTLVRTPAPGPAGLSPQANRDGLLSLAAGAAAEADANLRAELLYQDPTPLFLPTRWNSGRADGQLNAVATPGASFDSIAAKFVFPLAHFHLDVPDVVAVPRTALVALSRIDHRVSLAELPREDQSSGGLGPRNGVVEVRGIGSGTVLRRLEIPPGKGTWSVQEPLELLIIVDQAGLITRPTVVKSTDEVAVDLEQVTRELHSLRLGGVLGAGIYRILLGP